MLNKQEHKIQMIKDSISLMNKLFDDILEDGYEASLAINKIEEAQSWAIKSINREENKNENFN